MHVLVTGASSGIGAAIARRWGAEPGARLTAVARRLDRLEALAAEVPSVHPVRWDLAVPRDAAGVIDAAEAINGPVDVLVNNAGVQVIGPTAQVDPEAGERSVALNLLTPLRLAHSVLPGMLERGRGTIVNIASMAALAPTPGMTWYNAGKGGLAAASEALAGELLGGPVHVLTVYPGIIADTAMAEHGLAAYGAGSSLALRLQPTTTSAHLADAIVRSVRGQRPRLILPRSNGLARWFPAPTRWLLDRLTPSPVAP